MSDLEKDIYGKLKGSRNIGDWNAQLTPEQRHEHAVKSGEASGAARRKYSTFRAQLKRALMLDVDSPEQADAMKALGIEPTRQNAIVLASIAKAGTGDIEAARFVRDSIGEKPTEALQLAVSEQPIKALDLSGMTDEELEALADQADG